MAKTKEAERVPVTVPRGMKGEDTNFFISVNGKNYILPRGKTSMVPPEVAWEYNRSVAAQEAMYARQDEMIEAGIDPTTRK